MFGFGSVVFKHRRLGKRRKPGLTLIRQKIRAAKIARLPDRQVSFERTKPALKIQRVHPETLLPVPFQRWGRNANRIQQEKKVFQPPAARRDFGEIHIQ